MKLKLTIKLTRLLGSRGTVHLDVWLGDVPDDAASIRT